MEMIIGLFVKKKENKQKNIVNYLIYQLKHGQIKVGLNYIA